MKSTKRAIRVIKFTQLATKIAVVCLAAVVVLFSVAHLFINLRGKSLLIKNLQEAMGKKVTIRRLSTSFPLNVRIRGIDVEGVCKVKEVFLVPGGYDIFNRVFSLSLARIIRPEMAIEKNSNGSKSEVSKKPESKPSQPKAEVAPVSTKERPPLRLAINRLVVNDGVFDFTDIPNEKKKITISVRNLNLRMENLILGKMVSQITSFALQADLPWGEDSEKGKVNIDGWLNLKKKDMQAKINIEDIDGIAFHPYYHEWVDLENARIKKAKLNFSADVNSLNNDMLVHYRLELTDIVFRPRGPDEQEQKAEKIAHAVIGIFRNLNQGKIVLEQSIKTKMDNPRFGFDIIRKAFEDKITGRRNGGFDPQEVLILPSKLIEGTLKGISGVTAAFINGAITAGREISRAVQDGFSNVETPTEAETTTAAE